MFGILLLLLLLLLVIIIIIIIIIIICFVALCSRKIMRHESYNRPSDAYNSSEGWLWPCLGILIRTCVLLHSANSFC